MSNIPNDYVLYATLRESSNGTEHPINKDGSFGSVPPGKYDLEITNEVGRMEHIRVTSTGGCEILTERIPRAKDSFQAVARTPVSVTENGGGIAINHKPMILVAVPYASRTRIHGVHLLHVTLKQHGNETRLTYSPFAKIIPVHEPVRGSTIRTRKKLLGLGEKLHETILRCASNLRVQFLPLSDISGSKPEFELKDNGILGEFHSNNGTITGAVLRQNGDLTISTFSHSFNKQTNMLEEGHLVRIISKKIPQGKKEEEQIEVKVA